MMQNLFAKHLALEEHQVRVITKDVGGSFGIKVHTYADEMATVALSKLLKRPIKFVADRIESFVTDIHARDHRVKAKIGVKNDGTITAWEIDDLTGIGPYSVYPRTSGIEANQVVNLTGGPYTCPNYRARARVVFQNKNVMCQYRAVGHPIATAVTEGPDRARRRQDRHGPAGNPPAQSHRRRRASLARAVRHQVRGAVEPRGAGASRRDDELRGAARRAGEAAQAGHLSRHRLCELRRGDQSERGVLRRRRRAHLGAGRRDGAARRHRRDLLPHRRVRAGPGRGSRDRAMRRDELRRVDGSRARHHGRHRQHALRRRHLGVARGRHRRRSGLAGRQGAAAERAGGGGLDPAGQARDHGYPQRHRGRRRQREPSASASTRSRASPTSAPTPCPPASRPSSWRRAITCRAPGPSPSPTASRRAISRSTPTPAS